MGTCRSVRMGAAAIVGYSIGALAGSATVAWVLAAVAVAAVYLWSRRTEAACGAGCRPQRSRKERRLAEQELTPT